MGKNTRGITPQGKIDLWKEKQEELIEKQKLFLEMNDHFLDENGCLKFGVNTKELEKKWKEFKRG